MACDEALIVSAALESAMAGPQKVTGDAGSVEQYPLSDLIKADQYIRSKCATKNPLHGLRFTRLIPPGSV